MRGDLSRREMLAGLATAGVGGMTVGSTTAFLFDREGFSANIRGGTIDLAADGDGVVDGTATVSLALEGDDRRTEQFELRVPEDSNPAYAWLRTDCPVPSPLNDELDVTVEATYDGTTEQLATGTLGEVTRRLRDGTVLATGSGGSPACLQPGGGSVTISITVELVGDFTGETSTDVGFEFVAQQCRNTDARNPFDGASCDGSGGEQAISFIAFCSGSGGTFDPELTEVQSDDNGDPTAVEWETDTDVDFLVLYWASKMTIYDYRDEQKTNGRVKTDDPGAAIPSYDAEPGEASMPCEVANQQLAGNLAVNSSLKLEYEQGSFNRASEDNEENSEGEEGGDKQGGDEEQNKHEEEGEEDGDEEDGDEEEGEEDGDEEEGEEDGDEEEGEEDGDED